MNECRVFTSSLLHAFVMTSTVDLILVSSYVLLRIKLWIASQSLQHVRVPLAIVVTVF